jgi:hypothetical protein
MMMMRTSGGICKRCRNEIKGRERKKKKGKKQDADPDPDHRNQGRRRSAELHRSGKSKARTGR